MTHKVKILTVDIETAPLVGFTWSTWKVNIGLNQILCDWSILSYSAKWLDQKRVIYADTRGQGPALIDNGVGVRNDIKLLRDLWVLLDEADIVVTQNGVKFDKRKINARFIMEGMAPPSPYKVVDTYLEARKLAAFTSNRLAWLSEFLTDTPKDEHKDFPGFELWLECLKDNPKAWKVMQKYNCIDTPATEKVYLKLRPWIEGHPNVTAYDEEETARCPKCGGSVSPRGFTYTQTGKYQRYRCSKCGGWSRDRYTRNTMGKRKSMLSN
jgi:predicted RNA-binding Zn-ribbon protein involved in translation (DUF1610 family)